ncbi:1-acyl-sn-glycerol-3-phosphate acyltransferase [Phycicoccus sp. MAQZ13P-2]|uniref:1-acyl-sn-glycerol-3-phosphate acyltransferase n=1 Tax=Phycicoccus mangrovi TaxID=2840470 RepID=UPI001C0028D8|nr:1-acyl-sn-glycerol-3-phosphate acyltransferase [Phycicoccus mangrovi]MBT9255500.1 1-acyl-sn-glycerol-3-phosphate acyltransferase [Phycicoccus mangrovi]MBT9273470.1 1-acyl-sn-glycerol-3-phosphate acyltransferase [Phycicoccus mangrovi]
MGARGIPPPPRAVRRVLAPLWPFVGLVVTGLMVPVVVVGALHSLVDRRARLFRCACLAVLLMWVDIRMLVRCWVLGAEPHDDRAPEWREAHERLLADALDSLMFYTRRWLGLEVRLTDRMHFGTQGRPLLALARHAGPFDSLAVAWLLARTAGRLPRIVLAEALRWDPGVDTILTRLDSFFVPSAGEDRLAGVRGMAGSLDDDDVLLIFPEGQNWTPSRRAHLIERLRRRGEHRRAARAEALVNVLPPKTRGAWAAREARPEADVMVVAHAGYGQLSSPRLIWDAMPFRDRPFLVRTWTWRSEDVPSDPIAFAAWLDARWDEVDAWVTAHTDAGGIPERRPAAGSAASPDASPDASRDVPSAASGGSDGGTVSP